MDSDRRTGSTLLRILIFSAQLSKDGEQILPRFHGRFIGQD